MLMHIVPVIVAMGKPFRDIRSTSTGKILKH